MNIVFFVPALGGVPCRRFMLTCASSWQGWQEMKIFVWWCFQKSVSLWSCFLLWRSAPWWAGRLYCFINVAQNSLNASFCPQFVPKFC